MTAFDSDGSIFMGSRRDPAGCRVGLFGVPYDGTTSFRPGTRFGPAAIREVSQGLETYCPQLDLDLEDLAFADLGAVDISFGAPEPVVDAVHQATRTVLDLGLKPLMLGGEHSISSGAVAAVAEQHSDLVLVQLDAHADLREEWLGARHSHACAMRRCLEVLPSGDLLQLAIRSGTRNEFLELKRSGRRMDDVHAMREPWLPGPAARCISLWIWTGLIQPCFLEQVPLSPVASSGGISQPWWMFCVSINSWLPMWWSWHLNWTPAGSAPCWRPR